MSKMLLAGFGNKDDAERAVSELADLGIKATELSIIVREVRDETFSEAAADTAKRAVSGAATGGVIGGLAGLLVGAGVFPALAGFLIGGPIAAAIGLSGMAATAVSGMVTGAAAGGLVGALTRLGLSPEEASYYNQTVNRGGYILGVPIDENSKEQVYGVLEENGGDYIREINVEETGVS